MKYYETGNTDPRYNLAFEEYLFNTAPAGETLFILWVNRPSVIIGSFQNTAEEICADRAAARGIDVVRRVTGGGAVYHDLGNLNYSFIAPAPAACEGQDPAVPDFAVFEKPLVDALRSLGVPAEVGGRNDIYVNGLKFSGSAALCSGGKILHHGTIMFDVDLDAAADVLTASSKGVESKSTKSVRRRVTNIRPFLPDGMDIEGLKTALADNIEFPEALERASLTDDELAKVRALRDSKYAAREWNYGRDPEGNAVKTVTTPGGTARFCLTIQGGAVVSARITGDFFYNGDISAAEEAFRGAEYSESGISSALARSGLAGVLPGIKASDITG